MSGNVNAPGHASYAAEGTLLVRFGLLAPEQRQGHQPDLLLPEMRPVPS